MPTVPYPRTYHNNTTYISSKQKYKKKKSEKKKEARNYGSYFLQVLLKHIV